VPLPDFPELTGPAWQRASAALLVTMLAEYAYEGLLTPIPDESPQPADSPDGPADAAHPQAGARYRLELAEHAVYSFRARRGAFGAWRIQPGSVLRVADGTAAPATDPARLVTDARTDLGLTGQAAARLVRDINLALLGAVRDDARDRATAADLADMSYLDLEGRVGGRPGLVPDPCRRASPPPKPAAGRPRPATPSACRGPRCTATSPPGGPAYRS
jgi:siderophore synthetase component